MVPVLLFNFLIAAAVVLAAAAIIASIASTAILFYAFDVIIHRGRSLRHVPLETRPELLGEIAGDLKTRTPLIGLSDTLDTSPAELIPLVKEFGFERIIAKRRDSCYESGKRSGAWLK